MLLLGGWGLAGLSGGAEVMVELIYPDEYADAGWILRLLTIGMWFGVVMQGTRSIALVASGNLRRTTLVTIAKLLGMLIFMPIGYQVAQFPGAITGYVLADVCRYAVAVWMSAPLHLSAWRVEVYLTCWVAISAYVGLTCAQFVKSMEMSVLWQCVAVFLSVSLLWSVEMARVLRNIRARLRRQ